MLIIDIFLRLQKPCFKKKKSARPDIKTGFSPKFTSLVCYYFTTSISITRPWEQCMRVCVSLNISERGEITSSQSAETCLGCYRRESTELADCLAVAELEQG